jgi:ubiquinone/menaquinone biosynthesis C-methylase UbiE
MFTELDRDTRFREVGAYYENRAVRCWEITSRGHLHGGYWDHTNADREPWHGPLRMTERVIAATPVGRDDRVIDLGSGLGEPALLLAATTGCQVDGVTASQYQADRANQRAAEQRLSERVRFRVEDATALSFAPNTFDAGWCVESIFHMGHAAALGEAHRVLKPGAHLLITDFVNLPHTSAEFMTLQDEVLYAHHITAEEYPALLDEAGFELLDLSDITSQVILAAESKNREAFQLYHDEMLQVADADYLPFVEEVAALFAANAGYIFVQARARK